MYGFDVWNKRGVPSEMFDNYLEVCFKKSQYFSLTEADEAECTDSSLREALEPYHWKRFEAKKWFGSDYAGPSIRENTVTVNMYRLCDEVKDIFKRHFDDFFMRKEVKGRLYNSKQDLENLCFFSQNGVVSWSVSKEHIVTLDEPTEEGWFWKKMDEGYVIDIQNYVKEN